MNLGVVTVVHATFVIPNPQEAGMQSVRPFPRPHLHLSCTKPAKVSDSRFSCLRLNHFGSRPVAFFLFMWPGSS